MNAEEYRDSLLLIAHAARAIATVDVPDLLKRIEMAHSLGSVLDPTLYRQKVELMEQDRELLLAAVPLYRFVKAMKQNPPGSV